MRSAATSFPCLMAMVAVFGACALPSAPRETGGVDPSQGGVVVVNSDYSSTSISLSDKDGRVLSPVALSSASQSTGLNAALSGDVVLSTTRAQAGATVLIDRSHGVLTVLDIASGQVRTQLDVATGFAANPQDVVPLPDGRFYVSRFGTNLAAGSEPFDEGDDLLIVDLTVAMRLGRIDLRSAIAGENSGFRPAATGLVLAKGAARVALAGFNGDFSDALPARFATIDIATDSLSHTLVVSALRNCVQLAVAPSGTEIAAACSGLFVQDPASGWPDAGVVTLAVGEGSLELRSVWSAKRFSSCAADGTCEPTQPAHVAYIDEQSLLVTSFGRLRGDGQSIPDGAFVLRTREDSVTPLVVASAFSLGAPTCGNGNCLLPDAERGGLLRFTLPIDPSVEPQLEAVDTLTGLPPRFLQLF